MPFPHSAGKDLPLSEENSDLSNLFFLSEIHLADMN